MKRLLFTSLAFSALAVLSTGCLKDKDFEDQLYGTQVQDSKAVMFKARSLSAGILPLTEPQGPFNLALTYEGPTLAPENITGTIEVDNTLLAEFPQYSPLPAGTYNLDNTFTIQEGQRLDSVQLVITDASAYDPNLTYAIGVRIASVNGDYDIASNARTMVVSFTVKNKYDGIYEVTGTFADLSNPAFSGMYPLEYHLVTTGPNTVDVHFNEINGEIVPGYLFSTGSAGSYYGSFGLSMTFDLSTDEIIEIHNYYGDPTKLATGVGDPSTGSGPPDYSSSNTRRAVLDPSGINAYDEATETVNIKYFMLQPSVIPVGPRATFDEVWVRTGPRP